MIITKDYETENAGKLLAKTMFKELRKMGFEDSDIIDFSKEIILNLNTELQSSLQD